MKSSRIIFAAISNVKSPEDAKAVAEGRLDAASEQVCSMLPAKYIRAQNIETGVVFFLEDKDGENIFNRAVRLNRVLGGGIHSVETGDYGNEAYCFYTLCTGKLDEVAEVWKTLAGFHSEFVECIIHQSGKNTCYISGIINRRCLQSKDEEVNNAALAFWQQKVKTLCELMGSCRAPRFVPVRCNNLD